MAKKVIKTKAKKDEKKDTVEKGKVGRPKLADEQTKRETMFVCLFILAVMSVVFILGFKILTIDSNPKYMVGTIYNTHANSCIIENEKIDCGPGIAQMKYRYDDGEFTLLTRSDKNIIVDIDKKGSLEYCYKTNSSDFKCNKK